MTITYCRNDPVSGRWIGVNRLLTEFEVDYNFYQHETRISTLEGEFSTTVSISYITLHGDQLTFHMTDHTTRGPFTIPIATFRDRGTWQPSTPYSVNDTFDENGTLYLVIFDHVSQLTFSAGANDGMGHDYYSALLTVPGNSLPTGGAANQVLSKVDGTDFNVTWSYKLPTAGTTGQYLRKNSSTNQDASWHAFEGVYAPPPSPAGIAGQVLATRDGTDANTEWINVVYAPPPSPAGIAGQYLATVDGTHTNMEWVTQTAPALHTLSDVNIAEGSGINGYLLAWNNTASFWESVPPAALASLTDVTLGTLRDGDRLYYNNSASKWENSSVSDNNFGTSSGSFAIDPNAHPFFSITPNGTCAMDNSGRLGKAGQVTVIEITTSGTSSFNITFSSTDWVTQGTLATGTVSGKRFILSFMSDAAGKLHEINRIGPF
jgi:hypothetical protein